MSRRTFIQFGLVGGTGALVAACAASTPTTASPSAPVGPAATSAAASPTPRAMSGRLVAAMPQRFTALDPHGRTALSAAPAARQFADSLVVRDPVTGDIAAGLASSWRNTDPLTWIFQLRPGAMFHDGTAVRASDVKASFERMIKQGAPLGPLFADVQAVEAPDDATVRIRTKTPVGTLARNATTVFIGPAAKLDVDGFWNAPVGSGPFKVKEWKPDAQLGLEGNAEYWGGQPGVKDLVLRQIPEEIARITALETGEIHLTRGVSPDQLRQLRRNAELKFESGPSFTYMFAWMNPQRPRFADKRVRQAMWHALNIDAIVKDLLDGVAVRSKAPIPSTVFGYSPQTPYAYDVSRAKELLAQAGHPNGFETSILWAENQAGPNGRQILSAMISDWSKIGVRVRSDEFEQAKWVENLIALNWDMALVLNAVVTGDADYTLMRLYHSKAKRTGYVNADLDKALDAAATEVDQKQRAEHYAKACKIIWDEAVGIFPYELLETYVHRKNVQGVVVAPNEIPEFRRMSIT